MVVVDGSDANSATIALGFFVSMIWDKFISEVEKKLGDCSIYST
jgi:hypothetical protein